MKTALSKIRKFSTYTKGWDFGEGDSFSPKTIVQAFVINRFLINFRTLETDAFPCSEGKIAVTAYEGPWYWEFVIKKDGTIDHIVEKGDDIIEENKRLSFQEVLKLIKTCPIKKEVKSPSPWRVDIQALNHKLDLIKIDTEKITDIDKRLGIVEKKITTATAAKNIIAYIIDIGFKVIVALAAIIGATFLALKYFE